MPDGRIGHEERTKAAPHPTSGFVCVAPIPDPENDAEREKAAEAGKALGAFFGGMVIASRSLGAGIRQGIVIEVGAHVEAFGPEEDFTQGSPRGRTLYYDEAHATPVDGYHYVPVARVICWDPSPEEPRDA